MSILRKMAITTANALPPAWKRRLKWTFTVPDMGASLENMRRLGFSPRTALDIGAFVGKWTAMTKEIFPGCAVCMFEPQADKQERLTAMTRSLKDVKLVQTLLGETPNSSMTFYQMESGSSTVEFRNLNPNVKPIVLASTTLAAAVDGTLFARPDLIKIDVQGAELKVMNGGLDVIRAAQAVILELSLVEEYKGCPLLREMVDFMAGLGFRVYDICTIWRNNRTSSMNEADVIFVRDDSPLLNPANYHRDP